MTGKSRLPAARPGRQASAIRWKDRDGIFRREVGDSEHAEVVIGERVYRVKLGELA